MRDIIDIVEAQGGFHVFKAPITLMELGLHASEGKVVVCCPEGFWRRGNVQMVCARYDIPLVDTLEELISETRNRLA